MKKRVKIYVVLGIGIVALFLTYTYSYFRDKSSAYSSFQMGSNSIEIIEEFSSPSELNPGSEITKKIQVKNTGMSECVVRVKAVFTTGDMEKICTIDWNTSEWILKEDQYYYYKKIMMPEDISSPLLTTIKIDSDADINQIVPFDVIVYAESYHANAGDDYEAVWDDYQKNKPKGSEYAG